jgi:ribosome biogenesis protein Nip4
LVALGRYSLYINDRGLELFLVPKVMDPLVRQLDRAGEVASCGIRFGRIDHKRNRHREFLLSFEGGRFFYEWSQEPGSPIAGQVKSVVINETGVKAFMYGRPLEARTILSDTEPIRKRDVVAVVSETGEYLGLGLMKVFQAGPRQQFEDSQNPYFKGSRAVKARAADNRDYDLSRSSHFVAMIIALVDAGHYIRGGH